MASQAVDLTNYLSLLLHCSYPENGHPEAQRACVSRISTRDPPIFVQLDGVALATGYAAIVEVKTCLVAENADELSSKMEKLRSVIAVKE